MITQTITTRQNIHRNAGKEHPRPDWTRIILLVVLGYEAAGCLVGGSMLMATPDGSLMDMPIDIMHGVFNDFLVPGIILFALGVLNTFAFVSVLRKNSLDWMMAALALGGLATWFVVEIIILNELHWLHYMWGFPVFLGLVMLVPLLQLRFSNIVKALLICGVLSSIWYIAINVFVPTMYEGYSTVSFTVSELSAIEAPTRILWVLLAMLYPLLFAAFGWGILQSAGDNRLIRILGTLIILYSVLNFYWPPMHQRAVIAAGGGTLTDNLHIAWAIATVLLMMIIMAFGSAAFGNRFKLFTIATWLIFLVFGLLTGMESPGISQNLSTPHIGLWERINIGAFMLWVAVLASVLLSKQNEVAHSQVISSNSMVV
jgi:hypothetical protein